MPDSPELERFKAQVVEVAQRYAREHDLCGVVDEALAEMGLDKMNEFSQIKVLVSVPMVVPMEVRTGLISGISDEETKAKVQELLSPVLTRTAGLNFSDYRTVRPIQNARRGTADPEVGPPSVQEVIPYTPGNQPVLGVAGYVRRYSSDDGRVMHYVRPDDADRRHGYAVCGTLSYGWTETSARSTGNVCRRCAERTR